MKRAIFTVALVLGVAAPAAADIDDWTDVPQFSGSPEHFGLELRVGMHVPEGLGDSFFSSAYFGNDVFGAPPTNFTDR